MIIALENSNNMLNVIVKDFEIGIPSHEISKLFQKFKRVDNSSQRKISGTGLGLAVSKEIATKHRRKIWIKSAEGKGTTIYFMLPILQKSLQQENLINIQTGVNVAIVENDLSR